MRLAPLVLATLSLSSPAFAGKVWVVGPASGQLHDLQDTILLAQDGDVILVKSGTYESIRSGNKSVSIIAEVGATVQLPRAIRVIDVDADKSIVLSGLRAQSTGWIPAVTGSQYALFVQNCAGAVTVQDGVFAIAPPLMNPLPAAVSVSSCASLSMVRCSLAGGATTNAPGMRVGQGAFVDLHQVQATGADGRPGNTTSSGDGGFGQSGLILGAPAAANPSFVFASRSAFIGGAGGGGDLLPQWCAWGGDGGHGILGDNANGPLHLLECAEFGGAAGGLLYPSNCNGTGCPGVAGQSIYTTPYGSCWGGYNAPPTNHTNLAGTARVLSGTTLLRDTSLLSLTCEGVPGEVVELALSMRKPTFVHSPVEDGVLHIQQPAWRGIGTIPAGGTLTRQFKLPNLPLTNPGATYFVQARFLNVATGKHQLSNLHTVVEVDASY